jgi:hypothetical protein
MTPAKPLWKSKTLWTNLLVALAAMLVELSAVPDLGVDPKWVIVALAVVNAGLRLLTTQPVAVSPPEPSDPVP